MRQKKPRVERKHYSVQNSPVSATNTPSVCRRGCWCQEAAVQSQSMWSSPASLNQVRASLTWRAHCACLCVKGIYVRFFLAHAAFPAIRWDDLENRGSVVRQEEVRNERKSDCTLFFSLCLVELHQSLEVNVWRDVQESCAMRCCLLMTRRLPLIGRTSQVLSRAQLHPKLTDLRHTHWHDHRHVFCHISASSCMVLVGLPGVEQLWSSLWTKILTQHTKILVEIFNHWSFSSTGERIRWRWARLWRLCSGSHGRWVKPGWSPKPAVSH